MDETVILKLERIAIAMERVADQLNLIACATDRKVGASDKDAEAIEKRKAKESHNATICAEVSQLKDGSIVHIGQTKEGKEYAMLCLRAEGYGYFTAFIKRERIKGDWATELQRINHLGVRFVAEFYFNYQQPHGDQQRGRWTGSFMRFANEPKAKANAIAGTQQQDTQQAQSQDMQNDADVPF